MPESHQQQQRYRVIERLAAGGMAEVFRAESAGLEGFKKQVAIKRVLPHLSEKKKFISMFLDEARLSAHLSHSNCVQVFDIGVGDNAYFIVMEYVDGADLKAILENLRRQSREMAPEEAVFIALKICEGLAYAHELVDSEGRRFSIVHRDVSPPNVLITKHGEVKIVDFGLAKASSQLERSEPGIIKGKFSYLSPEASLGHEVDHRTDIFAVGIILWEMLAGRRLFLGESDYATVKLVREAQVPPIPRMGAKILPALEQIVAKALARDPEQRYQSARELALALNEFLFLQARAVGSFSIASLVQTTIRDKQRARPPQPSIIDKLIEEALFEFTSLQEQGKVAPSDNNEEISVGSAPLSLDKFQQAHDWLNEINLNPQAKPPSDRPSVLGTKPVEAGNLAAALEGDDAEDALPFPKDIQPSPTPLAGGTAPVDAPELAEGPASGHSRGSSLGVIFVAILVALAILAVAYYTGLLPGGS